jgi:uncharacterized protein (DUF58 family)
MTRMRATCSLAAALILAAAAFDSPSLYVPGIGLLLLAAAALAWVRLARRDVVVERLPGAWSVEEGKLYKLLTSVEVGRIRPPRLRLVDPLLEEPLALDPDSGVVEATTRFAQRGRQRLPNVKLELSDHFELRVGQVSSHDRPAVLVLPRIEEVKVARLGAHLSHRGGFGSGVGEESGLDAEAVDFELDGLRPYRVGSPASRIHWRSVARGGELVEHRMVSGGGSEPLLVLDSHLPDGRDALDAAVRAAASLCLVLAREGGCNLLLPEEAHPLRIDAGLRSWPEVHARLALVEGARRPPRAPRTGSIVYWVGASERAAGHAAAAAAGSGFLITPGAAGPGDAFEVAGCRGRALEPQRRETAVGGSR